MKDYLLAIVLMFLALVSTAQAVWTGTEADRNISFFSGDTKSTWYTRGAVGPEGNIYLIWQQEQSFQLNGLFFGRSTDNGATWSSTTADRQINAVDSTSINGVGDRPLDIGTDNGGNIFVVWPEDFILGVDTTSEIMFMKSTDQGSTWIHSDINFPISHIGAPFADAFNPSMAIDHNNNIYVVWHQGSSLNMSEIHISKSTDGGETWSGQTADRYISHSDGFLAANPDIAIDQNNVIYVVWDEMADTSLASAQILYGKSNDGGATFNCEIDDLPISNGHLSASDPYLVIDLESNIYVTWRATYSTESPFYYQAFFSSSTDGGANWSGTWADITVDQGIIDGYSVSFPAIAVTSEGYLIVVWNEAFNSVVNQQVYASYSYDGGQFWTAVSDGADLLGFPEPQIRPSFCPDIVCSPGDTLYVFWNEGVMSNGYNDIHYSKGDTLTEARGALYGYLYEEDGLTPIPDVLVETYDSLNQLIEVDTTADAGDYFIALPQGIYRQHFSKSGYNDFDYEGLEILVGQVTDLSIYLSAIQGCQYICGDINNNGSTNGIDVVYGVNYFKGSTPPPVVCDICPQAQPFYAAGDVNGNCSFNGIDVTFFVNYLKGVVPALLYCPTCPPMP